MDSFTGSLVRLGVWSGQANTSKTTCTYANQGCQTQFTAWLRQTRVPTKSEKVAARSGQRGGHGRYTRAFDVANAFRANRTSELTCVEGTRVRMESRYGSSGVLHSLGRPGDNDDVSMLSSPGPARIEPPRNQYFARHLTGPCSTTWVRPELNRGESAGSRPRPDRQREAGCTLRVCFFRAPWGQAARPNRLASFSTAPHGEHSCSMQVSWGSPTPCALFVSGLELPKQDIRRDRAPR